MSPPVTIISADTHGGADIDAYLPYLPSRFHDDFAEWKRTFRTAWLDDDVSVNWDSDRRRSILEDDGIAAEVVFPNTYPPFFPGSSLAGTLPESGADYDRRWAGLLAHNRWVVDFCAELPGRRKAVIQLLPNSVEDMLDELRWAAGHDAVCGALLTSVPPNTVEPLYHHRYEPLWATAVELGIPIVTHAGGGAPDLPVDEPATMPVLIYEYAFWSHRTLWHLVFGGVFERHPDLRYVITEQGGCKWLGALARALDDKLDALVDPEKQTVAFDYDMLKLQPSEYIARNCWLGASFLQPHDVPHRHDVNLDHIVWGSDFPHREGTTPYTREALRAGLVGVPEIEIRSMLGDAAAELYGFDLDALAPVAERVGPSLEELTTPLDEVPADSTSYAFHAEYQATY